MIKTLSAWGDPTGQKEGDVKPKATGLGRHTGSKRSWNNGAENGHKSCKDQVKPELPGKPTSHPLNHLSGSYMYSSPATPGLAFYSLQHSQSSRGTLCSEIRLNEILEASIGKPKNAPRPQIQALEVFEKNVWGQC